MESTSAIHFQKRFTGVVGKATNPQVYEHLFLELMLVQKHTQVLFSLDNWKYEVF